MVSVSSFFSPEDVRKVQMLPTLKQRSVLMVLAVKAVSRRPGAFVFDIVT